MISPASMVSPAGTKLIFAIFRSSLFALGKPQQPPPCLLSDGNISGRSSPPSTSARLPLRSGGITSRFAVGRASGRDDQRFPPLHRPIERLGKRPPRLAGEPCPAPLLSGLSGAEGGGCPPPQGLLGFGGGGDVPPPLGCGVCCLGVGVWGRLSVWLMRGCPRCGRAGRPEPNKSSHVGALGGPGSKPSFSALVLPMFLLIFRHCFPVVWPWWSIPAFFLSTATAWNL